MASSTLPDRAVVPVDVERWPTEIPFLVLVATASFGLWLFLALSVFGIVYAGLIGLVLFFTHVAFVAQVRGSAVRLGPQQFPELYERVVELSRRAGIDPVPEAFLMESGGALNALATRMFRARMIILYADLLDACGDNDGARDMVIGHELGHIRAGHLSWIWLLAPGLVTPFLGSAYSRAREYTCDRYGAALCGRHDDALVGLAILAAGRSHGPRVNLGAFASQRTDLDRGWMTLGKWRAGHPPLCERIGALAPALTEGLAPATRGPVRALALVASFLMVVGVATAAFFVALAPRLQAAMEEAAALQQPGPTPFAGNVEEARATVDGDFDRIARLVTEVVADTGSPPEDVSALQDAWSRLREGVPFPQDPFDGLLYGYEAVGDGVFLWSTGPDGESGTEDDIVHSVGPDQP